MRLIVVFACLSTLVAASPAMASTIIDRNATGITLQVNAKGEALVGYHDGGKAAHVLAWGAVNAIAPTRTRAQTDFKLDYSGGYNVHYAANPAVKSVLAQLRTLQEQMAKASAAGNNQLRYALAPKIAATYKQIKRLRAASTAFTSNCRPYSGPALPWLVTACTAPDGSYWALQSWQRMLPNLGLAPWLPAQSVRELHLSHWTGPLPELEIHLDWVNTQKAHHLFGRLTYLGQPVYGFGSSSAGNPTDSFGRNIYLDVYNPPGYGVSGWTRENSFLTHKLGGNFCYGFYSHAPYPGYPPGTRPPGYGERYRATVIGPGVLPDVSWQGEDLGAFNPEDSKQVAYEQEMNSLNAQWSAGDSLCHQN